MRKKARLLWSLVLLVAMLFQTLGLSAAAQGSTEVQQTSSSSIQATASSENGLPNKTKDGVIFHAWNWSFDNIKNNLPAIAAAGYKSIQTSPIQGTKENSMEGSKWWVLYQPTNFKIGNAQLGSRDQFKQMCEEAEKYGISIIVDVVANHTANAGGGNLQYAPAYNVDPAIRNNGSFWHEARGVENWDNRWQVTQWGIGLPDLNTANQELQNIIIAFLNDAIACGADGFRFDAAKHIELPNDAAPSNFWTRVLGSLNNKENLYIYGEVLQGGADNFDAYANYINLAAANYGHSMVSAVGYNSSKNVNNAKFYSAGSVSPSKLVTWVESHDTYANDKNETTYMNEWQIKMGWSIIAARAETTSLFFNRPSSGGKFNSSLGNVGNTQWKDPDVVAVNKFHNAMAGQGENLRTQGNEIMLVERGTKGMTIINLGTDATINSPTNLANGTYVNKASGGGTFTVSNGKITGNIGGGKIAVLYEAGPPPTPTPAVSIDTPEGGFYSDSLTVKMTYSNADSATYTLGNGSPITFSSGSTVSFGAGAAFGTTFALKITANNTAGQTTQTYTFVKEDPNAALSIHFYKPSGWGTPNMYYYDDSVTPTKVGAAWPGSVMKDEGNGWYVYQVQGWKQGKVIFNSGSNQIPGASQPGYAVSGEKWIKDGVITSKNPDVTTPTITIDKSEGAFNTESLDVTISYKDADSATYSLNGGTAVAFTSGHKVTFGAGDASGTKYTLSVTASNSGKTTTKSYSFTKTKQDVPAPTITIDKAEGVFNGDSLDVTISYKDSSTATYSLNGGTPVAFTSGHKVTFGAGDATGTTYTLSVTATNGDKTTTKSYSFTKTKQDVPAPTLSIDKAEGVFYSDSLDVTISYKDASTAAYSVNGGTPVVFASGQKVTFGAGDASGTNYTLSVTATNGDKNTTKTYTFTKEKKTTQTITVHYYKPADWGTPNIYYYDETVSPKKENAAWPGIGMQNDGNDWYSYTIDGWDKAYVIFNSNGKQTPASKQPGYLLTGNAWIKNGVISDQEPVVDQQRVSVTFNIKNATTYVGQSVYITGNIAELGNWNPENAVGPGLNPNYPNWTITVSLPVGTNIEFKAIKKDGNKVVWEGGKNHTYTVTSSNPVVDFNFSN